MQPNRGNDVKIAMTKVGFGEHDAETVERVHQENIRRSRLALEQSKKANITAPKQYTWKQAPREVQEHEITAYQGTGGRKQMLRAQARKRRQVRRHEASIWDDIAPKEVHGILNLMVLVIFIMGLLLTLALHGYF